MICPKCGKEAIGIIAVGSCLEIICDCAGFLDDEPEVESPFIDCTYDPEVMN